MKNDHVPSIAVNNYLGNENLSLDANTCLKTDESVDFLKPLQSQQGVKGLKASVRMMDLSYMLSASVVA